METPLSSNLFEVSGGEHGLDHVYFSAYHHALRGEHPDPISQYLRDFNEGAVQVRSILSFASYGAANWRQPEHPRSIGCPKPCAAEWRGV